LILLFLFLGLRAPVLAQSPTILINELMVYPAAGEQEWIELFNPNETESVDLSGMWIMVTQGTEPNYTYQYRLDLSGTLPRLGFLTFSTQDKLPDDGACLSIFTAPTVSIFSLKYGNGECDPGADPVDATTVGVQQGKSINAQTSWNTQIDPPEGNWVLSETPSRGWCDTTDPECFQISTLTSILAAKGVTSNIADQTDLSRTSSLYFEKTGYGRIAFANQINLTDKDAMTWMQLLDQKLSISQGVISLDAELIKNLVDTRATLTMYNITLDNPTIEVINTDGTPGDSSIVSGLTYDRQANTLTFVTAHFTTFRAVEGDSSSGDDGGGSPSTASPPRCADLPPSNAPHLFQIETTQNQATLYFTPVNDYLSYYYIAYGYSEGDERFGVEFPASLAKGVQSYTIDELSPQTTYYFRVRGGNGCAPGDWSGWLAARTKSSFKEEQQEEEPVVTKEEESEKEETIFPSPSPTPSPVLTLSPSPLQPPSSAPVSFWQRIINFFRRLFRLS